MKNLIFESLELLSLTEKKARGVTFHPRLTVITGTNGVGKSSIIKSIYWTLGASAVVIHPKWPGVNVKGLLTFTVDGQRYKALRNHDRIAIFDANDALLISSDSFTKELAPFIADMLDFRIVFSRRQTGEPETPPPAYAFLPFYVDQDGGWAKPLTSFDHLMQYPSFKKPLIEFHTGIRPNRYYELTADKKKLELEIRDIAHELRIIRRAVERLNLEPRFTGLELSAPEHEVAVDDLLIRLKTLRDVRQARMADLADLFDQRKLIDDQAAIVQAAANELALDVQWATDDERDEIPCPTCGTLHMNDFANRFGILSDREECFEFLSNAKLKRRDIVRHVEKAQTLLTSTEKTISEVQELLEQQRGDVTLRDVIQNEGRRSAFEIFKAQMQDLESSIGTKTGKVSEIDDELKKLNDKARKKLIEDHYARLMVSYLKDLNVTDPDLDAVTKITGKIVETGSEQPRLLLAYVMALTDTIQKFTTAFTAPMIIDSPVQQEQDNINAPAIINRVTAKRPDGGQTIIGTISLHGVQIKDGSIIELTAKQSALLEGDYEAVYAKIDPLLQRM